MSFKKWTQQLFLTYQNSSELLQGRDYNVLKLLSYEGVAEDFKEFLDNTDKPDNSGETYSGIYFSLMKLIM